MTARKKTNTNPTEKQIESGNYAKGKFNWNGLRIAIENPKGSTRSGTDSKGKKWSIEMKHEYGYILGTVGADKDHLDVFIGTDPDSELVYIVNQVDPDSGKFDEVKIMLGFVNQSSAEDGYLSNYEPNWRGLGSIKPMTLPSFKRWLDGDTTKKAAQKHDTR